MITSPTAWITLCPLLRTILSPAATWVIGLILLRVPLRRTRSYGLIGYAELPTSRRVGSPGLALGFNTIYSSSIRCHPDSFYRLLLFLLLFVLDCLVQGKQSQSQDKLVRNPVYRLHSLIASILCHSCLIYYLQVGIFICTPYHHKLDNPLSYPYTCIPEDQAPCLSLLLNLDSVQASPPNWSNRNSCSQSQDRRKYYMSWEELSQESRSNISSNEIHL